MIAHDLPAYAEIIVQDRLVCDVDGEFYDVIECHVGRGENRRMRSKITSICSSGSWGTEPSGARQPAHCRTDSGVRGDFSSVRGIVGMGANSIVERMDRQHRRIPPRQSDRAYRLLGHTRVLRQASSKDGPQGHEHAPMKLAPGEHGLLQVGDAGGAAGEQLAELVEERRPSAHSTRLPSISMCTTRRALCGMVEKSTAAARAMSASGMRCTEATSPVLGTSARAARPAHTTTASRDSPSGSDSRRACRARHRRRATGRPPRAARAAPPAATVSPRSQRPPGRAHWPPWARRPSARRVSRKAASPDPSSVSSSAIATAACFRLAWRRSSHAAYRRSVDTRRGAQARDATPECTS